LSPSCCLGWPDGFVEKSAQNAAQPIFCQNRSKTFTVEWSSPKIWTASVIKKPLQGVNNHPKGSDSPNLVTMVEMDFTQVPKPAENLICQLITVIVSLLDKSLTI
jgi:hypothetical protein